MSHHRILHYLYSDSIIQSITGGLECLDYPEYIECIDCMACLCLGIRSIGSFTGDGEGRIERIESEGREILVGLRDSVVHTDGRSKSDGFSSPGVLRCFMWYRGLFL